MALSHSACRPSNPDARAAGNGGAEDADISSLLGMLASVADPRSPQGIQHALEFVLAVCVVAMDIITGTWLRTRREGNARRMD